MDQDRWMRVRGEPIVTRWRGKAWVCVSAMPAVGRRRHKDWGKFEASLVYIASSKLARVTLQGSVSKQKNRNTANQQVKQEKVGRDLGRVELTCGMRLR